MHTHGQKTESSARRPSQTKGREASGEARPANTLIVDFKPPELWDWDVLLLKPRACGVVRAGPAGGHGHEGGLSGTFLWPSVPLQDLETARDGSGLAQFSYVAGDLFFLFFNRKLPTSDTSLLVECYSFPYCLIFNFVLYQFYRKIIGQSFEFQRNSQ